MKASELINELQKLVWAEGDCDIVIFADHRQSNERVNFVTLVHTIEPEQSYPECHNLDGLAIEDRAEYIKNGTKFIEIS